MVGVEYILLHVQDPILYVIRKQHRHSPTEATPMADYYIIAGTIYQAPDLASVFNSRLVNRSRSVAIQCYYTFHFIMITKHSYQQYITCRQHSKKQVYILDIIQIKDIHGTLPAIKHVCVDVASKASSLLYVSRFELK